MKGKYPEYILKKLREMDGVNENNTSKDEKYQAMRPREVFKEVCEWEGFHGWSDTLIGWLQDIYDFDIDNMEEDV